MATYDKAITTAQKLISKYGTSATLQHPATAPLDVTMPWRGPGDVASPITISVIALLTKYTGKVPVTEATRRSVQTVLVAPTANADNLTSFTQMLIGSVLWLVDEIEIVSPGGVVVLWKFHLKK